MSNVRKLKIYLANVERKLRECDPRDRGPLRDKRKAFRMALLIAKQARAA